MRLSRVITWLMVVSWCNLLASSVRAEAERNVTLESLLQAGRRNHPTLAKQPLLEKSLELSSARLDRAYYPQLSLGGRATWQSEVTSVNVPIPGVNISPPPQDQYRATLDLKQTLWDGGVTSDQKRVIEERTRVEREKVNVEWYQVRARILELYFAGLVQQELKAQAETLHRYLGTVVDKARVALSNGVATQRDVLLAQARRLQASQAVASAKAALASAKQSLARLVLTDVPNSAPLATPPVQAVKKCWASLFEPRAIFYRVENKFEHMKVGLSAVVQKMVQSEKAGVVFTVDPLYQDYDIISIEGAYGLGEVVAMGWWATIP